MVARFTLPIRSPELPFLTKWNDIIINPMFLHVPGDPALVLVPHTNHDEWLIATRTSQVKHIKRSQDEEAHWFFLSFLAFLRRSIAVWFGDCARVLNSSHPLYRPVHFTFSMQPFCVPSSNSCFASMPLNWRWSSYFPLRFINSMPCPLNCSPCLSDLPISFSALEKPAFIIIIICFVIIFYCSSFQAN
jgi:hypothetical protein